MQRVRNIPIIYKLKAELSSNNSALRNILSIGSLRAGNVLIQLLLIPVSIKFVSPESFGLWLTLSSMVTWLNIMDIGLSNGLRNKITEFNTKGNFKLSQIYVSTTYGILSLIAVAGCIIGIVIIYLVNWRSALSIPADLDYKSFRTLLFIILSSFFLTFLLKPIASVSYAVHKPFIEYLILLISNAANLAAVYVLVAANGHGSILTLAVVFCFTPIVVTFFLTIYFFRNHFKLYSPKFSLIEFKHSRDLMSLSGKFFIIQIAATIVFTTNNFLISHYIGNGEVTVYNIAYRYFNTALILQSMVLVPFWAIFTENYYKEDAEALKSNMTKLIRSTLLLIALTVIMLALSKYVYQIWIGSVVEVPFVISLWMAIFTVLQLVSAVFTTFINGTGKVRVQMYTSIMTSVLHVPVSIVLIHTFHLQVIGLLITSSIWFALTIPLRIFQYNKILQFKTNSKTIWIQ